MVLAHTPVLLSGTNTTLLLFLQTGVSFPLQEPEKQLSVVSTANRELVVPREVLVPFKDKGLLEYEKDNAAWGNDKQPTVSIQYSCVG